MTERRGSTSTPSNDHACEALSSSALEDTESATFVDSPCQDVRILHYLGSKRRMLNLIRDTIADVVPQGGRVCDLFAGSGSVSLGLAPNWDVVSVDIQEYSRVLCNGLLNPPANALDIEQAIVLLASEGNLRNTLRKALGDLLAYERKALLDAESDNILDLCDLLEHGSLLAVDQGIQIPVPQLDIEMQRASNRLRAVGLASGPDTVMTRYYGGIYFSWEQAIDLDALLHVIHSLDDSIRDHFLAAALSVASDVVNTVGKQFAQPIKPRDSKGQPKTHLIKQTIRDRTTNVFDSFQDKIYQFSRLQKSQHRHHALRSDYREVLLNREIQFDAVYADPPYTRDHYSRYYHVLETMALHDEPEVSTTMIRTGGAPKLSRGLYRTYRHQSPFCIKTQAPGAFDEMFRSIAERQAPLVLSYSPYKADAGNRPRLLTIEELLAIARNYFGNVVLQPVDGMSHNKFNVSERNVEVTYHAEILLVCSP